MRDRMAALWSALVAAFDALYRDVLVFGGGAAVAWGLAGYDGRWALIWAGLFCVWMGLGAPGIHGGK